MILTRVGRSHRKGLHSGRKAARLSCFARGSSERKLIFDIVSDRKYQDYGLSEIFMYFGAKCEPLLLAFAGLGDDFKSLKRMTRDSDRYGGIEVAVFPSDPTEDDVTDTIVDHLEIFPLSPVVFLGHSLGGKTAWYYHESECRSQYLITLDPVSWFRTPHPFLPLAQFRLSGCPGYRLGKGVSIDIEDVKHEEEWWKDYGNWWINIYSTRVGDRDDWVAKLGNRWQEEEGAFNIRLQGGHTDGTMLFGKRRELNGNSVEDVMLDVLRCPL